MSLNTLSSTLQTLLILTLTSPPAAGKPLPLPGPAHPSQRIEARASSGDGTKMWEVMVIIVGAIVAIMLIGSLGGVCEVMLHTRGKIVRSNAEADAKVANGSRAVALDDGEDDDDDDDDERTEVDEEVDPSHFSWQKEMMTTGGDIMSGDQKLWRADTDESSHTTLNGEQGSVDGSGHDHTLRRDVDLGWDLPAVGPIGSDFIQGQTRDRVLPWEEDHQRNPDPALSQFVIGGEEEGGPGYDYHGQDYHTEPVVTMPDEAHFQNANAEYGHQEDNIPSYKAYSNAQGGPTEPSPEQIGQALCRGRLPLGGYV